MAGDEYKKGYNDAIDLIRKMLKGQISRGQASTKTNSKLDPIPIPVQIGDRGNKDIQEKEAKERAEKAVQGDVDSAKIQQLKDLLQNPTVAKAAIDHIRNIRNQEKIKKQGSKGDEYRYSPLTRFKESINQFVKNLTAERRGPSWRHYNSKYARTGLLRPGTTMLDPNGKIPLIQVYFDVSGSWTDQKIAIGEQAIATLNQYVRKGQIRIEVWYFSTYVSKDRAVARQGGGTLGKPIIQNVKETRPANVIVMTDSDISDCGGNNSVTVPGGVWFLFCDGVSDNIRSNLNGEKFTKSFTIDSGL